MNLPAPTSPGEAAAAAGFSMGDDDHCTHLGHMVFTTGVPAHAWCDDCGTTWEMTYREKPDGKVIPNGWHRLPPGTEIG